MAVNNLNVIGEIKQELMRVLLSESEIVRIVANKADATVPAMDLRYAQIVPWKKKMATQLDAQVVVAFDIVPNRAINCAVRSYTLYVWIMVHDSLMKFDSAVGNALGVADRGTRLDVLMDKVDYLLNGEESWCFEELEFTGAPLFDPSEYYHGRQLTYTFKSWNRHGDKL